MGPERRFGITLLLSVALWFPTLQELLGNNVDLSAALLRYAIGFGVAWVAVAFVDKMLSGYRDTNVVRRQMSRMRRRTDLLPEIAEIPPEAPREEPAD